MEKITEQSSNFQLDQMNTFELLNTINQQDILVPLAISKSITSIENLVNAVYEKLKDGGRLFYLGAGTSGRLGIVDASECPPTYGVPYDLVNGIIAGGDSAIRKAVEFAEDNTEQAWIDLQAYKVDSQDFIIGITASGSTPYVVGALKKCKENNIQTGSIACNPNSKVSEIADFPIEIVVGPEVVTGSTRMKAGTAQKLVLNMISTSVMIKLGKVVGNKMVNMQLSNNKLIERGINMLLQSTDWNYETAKQFLIQFGSVKASLDYYYSTQNQ